MDNRKKYRVLSFIIIVLVAICVIQGFFIFKNSSVKFPWDKHRDKSLEQFSSSILDKLKKDKQERWDEYDRFFDDDFFRHRDDPFQEMELMRRRMQEMMKKEFKKPFQNSWDGWFSNRFYEKSNDIKIHTKEKEDSFIVTIDIPHLKENKLNVNVDESGIHIDAEVEQVVEKKDSQGNVISSSKIYRKVDQTFPIPYNANYQSATMEYKKDKVIVTMPKIS